MNKKYWCSKFDIFGLHRGKVKKLRFEGPVWQRLQNRQHQNVTLER